MKWHSTKSSIERLRAYRYLLDLKMGHPKTESDLIPIGTICIWTRPSHRVNPKVVKVKIVEYGFQNPQGVGFLNYYVEIIGQPGKYAAYHQDLKIEKGPSV